MPGGRTLFTQSRRLIRLISPLKFCCVSFDFAHFAQIITEENEENSCELELSAFCVPILFISLLSCGYSYYEISFGSLFVRFVV